MTTMTMTPGETRPSGKEAAGRMRGALTITGATLGMATGFGSLVLASVFMPALEAEFGWSKSQVSMGYAFAALGMAIGGIGWGRVSDRVDIRWLLAFGGAFLFLPLLAMSAVTQLWHFYAANLVMGVAGFGCLYAPLLSAAGECSAARRGLVVGIVTAGGAVGQGVMPYVADGIIAAQGWRAAYESLALLVLVIQAIVALTVRRPAGPIGAVAKGDATRFFFMRTPRLVALALAAFLCCACMGMPLIHLAGFVGSVCGSPSLGATSLLIAMSAGAVGRVCFGLTADRVGNIPAYAVASFIQTACLIAFPLLGAQMPLLVLSAVFGFGFAGNMTCLILCIRDEVPGSHFGAAIGTVMFIAWAGMGVGGYMGGTLFDLTGNYLAAFLSAAAFGTANIVILGLLAGAVGPLRNASLRPA